MYSDLLLGIVLLFASFLTWDALPSLGLSCAIATYGTYCTTWGIYLAIRIKTHREKIVLRLGHLTWSLQDFVRGWLVMGKTGSGKTSSGLCNIVPQLFETVPDWGGLFLASKGMEHEIITAMAEHFKVPDKALVVRTRTIYDPAFVPDKFLNLIGNPRILEETYARAIIDTAQSQGRVGTGGASDHFNSLAYLHIKNGIALKKLLGETPTLYDLYEFLTSEETLQAELERLAKRSDEFLAQGNEFQANAANEIYNEFHSKYLQLGDDEKSGCKTSLTNCLEAFTHPYLREVFSSSNPNVSMEMMDQGKIICVSVAPEFSASKPFIDTLCKIQYFSHGLSRAALPPKIRYTRNLLLLIADEAQDIVTKNEQGMCDHKAIAKTREFNVTALYLTQGESAFLTKLGKEASANLIMNLSNELIFKAANDYGAKEASLRIGERKTWQKTKSYGKGGVGYSYTEAWKPKYHPQQLRELQKFEAIIIHCEKGHDHAFLAPTPFTTPSSVTEEKDLPEPKLSAQEL